MKQPEVTCTCSPVTTFLPLIIVLGISIVKEAIEDFGRYRADREVNNRKVAVFSPAEGRFIDKAWKLVQVPASPCRSVALAGVRLLFGPGAFLRKAAQSLGLQLPATHGTRCGCSQGGAGLQVAVAAVARRLPESSWSVMSLGLGYACTPLHASSTRASPQAESSCTRVLSPAITAC